MLASEAIATDNSTTKKNAAVRTHAVDDVAGVVLFSLFSSLPSSSSYHMMVDGKKIEEEKFFENLRMSHLTFL
jgi:hypothetical protein